jgi:hypothetical protein
MSFASRNVTSNYGIITAAMPRTRTIQTTISPKESSNAPNSKGLFVCSGHGDVVVVNGIYTKKVMPLSSDAGCARQINNSAIPAPKSNSAGTGGQRSLISWNCQSHERAPLQFYRMHSVHSLFDNQNLYSFALQQSSDVDELTPPNPPTNLL